MIDCVRELSSRVLVFSLVLRFQRVLKKLWTQPYYALRISIEACLCLPSISINLLNVSESR